MDHHTYEAAHCCLVDTCASLLPAALAAAAPQQPRQRQQVCRGIADIHLEDMSVLPKPCLLVDASSQSKPAQGWMVPVQGALLARLRLQAAMRESL